MEGGLGSRWPVPRGRNCPTPGCFRKDFGFNDSWDRPGAHAPPTWGKATPGGKGKDSQKQKGPTRGGQVWLSRPPALRIVAPGARLAGLRHFSRCGTFTTTTGVP